MNPTNYQINSNSENVLLYANVSISTSNLKIPESLEISNQINNLLNKEIKRKPFDKEYELIANYSDLKSSNLIKNEEIKFLNNKLEPEVIAKYPADQCETLIQTTSQIDQIKPIIDPNDHEALIVAMMDATKQERNTCYFYLESAAWNLEDAIAFLNIGKD